MCKGNSSVIPPGAIQCQAGIVHGGRGGGQWVTARVCGQRRRLAAKQLELLRRSGIYTALDKSGPLMLDCIRCPIAMCGPRGFGASGILSLYESMCVAAGEIAAAMDVGGDTWREIKKRRRYGKWQKMQRQ